MIRDEIIIDGVAHGYDFSPSNRTEYCTPEQYRKMAMFMALRGHQPLESKDPGFMLSPREFSARWTAEALAHAFFVESDVDIVFYHHVNIDYYFKGGASRWDTGVELRNIAPGRVYLYGYVDTFATDKGRVFAEMERQAEQGVVGFKFYPSSGFFDGNRKLIELQYDTPDDAYLYFEKARELGVTRLAFHKAQPVGPGSLAGLHPSDLSSAAAAFPELTFEVVHDGWHFLDECAIQLRNLPNIYANLECVINLVVRQPRRFAHILGRLLSYGGPDRLIFATGCAFGHPKPVLDAFMKFSMPEDLIKGYDYPEVTWDDKRKILGGNMARLHNIDLNGIKQSIADDRWAKLRASGTPPPWTRHREIISSPSYPYPQFSESDFSEDEMRSYSW